MPCAAFAARSPAVRKLPSPPALLHECQNAAKQREGSIAVCTHHCIVPHSIVVAHAETASLRQCGSEHDCMLRRGSRKLTAQLPERIASKLTTGCNVCGIAATASSDDSSVAVDVATSPACVRCFCQHVKLFQGHSKASRSFEQAIQCM